MNFSEALYFLKNDRKLFRAGWNGKNLVVYKHFPSAREYSGEQLASNIIFQPHFRIWDKEKKTINIWVPSVSDIFADDWQVYEEKEG